MARDAAYQYKCIKVQFEVRPEFIQTLDHFSDSRIRVSGSFWTRSSPK
jgi:hypothetical protein